MSSDGPMLDEATQKELERQMMAMLPPEAQALPEGFEDPSARAAKRERKEKLHLFRQKRQKETNRRKEKNRRKANRRNRR